MAFRRRAASIFAALATSSLPLVIAGAALAQPAPPPKPKPVAPPGTKTDMEIDPDAKPAPPPELPPTQPGQWGVGGNEEEGKFAPPSKKKQEEEEAAKKAEDDKKPADLGPARHAWLDTVVGFGTFHDVVHDGSNEAGRTHTTHASFILGFTWRVADIWTIGARYGFVRANDNGPAGPFNNLAGGNLELLVRPSFQLTQKLRLPAQVSLFLPTAQGDFFPDVNDPNKTVASAVAQANLAAQHGRGWEEMPLFATKRFGLRLGVGITWDKDAFHVAAGTKIDLMLKTGGGEPYTGYFYNNPNYAWVTDASFHYSFLDGKLEPGLRVWFVYATLPTKGPTNYSGPQLVFEPQVNTRIPVNADKTMAVKAGIGFIAPTLPNLVGSGAPYDASMKGFRINAGFEF